jgi:hypothetical protein
MQGRLRVLRNSLDVGAPISPKLHENNLEALENNSTHLRPFVPSSRASFEVVHDRVRGLSEARQKMCRVRQGTPRMSNTDEIIQMTTLHVFIGSS